MFTFTDFAIWRFKRKIGWDESGLYSNLCRESREILDFTFAQPLFKLSVAHALSNHAKLAIHAAGDPVGGGIATVYSSSPVEEIGVHDVASGETFEDWNRIFPKRTVYMQLPPPPLPPDSKEKVVATSRDLVTSAVSERLPVVRTHLRPPGERPPAEYLVSALANEMGVEAAYLFRWRRRILLRVDTMTPWRLAGSSVGAQACLIARDHSVEVHMSTRELMAGVRVNYDMNPWWTFGGEAYYTAAGSGSGALSLGVRYNFATHPTQLLSFVEEVGKELFEGRKQAVMQKNRLRDSVPSVPPEIPPPPPGVPLESPSVAPHGSQQIPLEPACATYTASPILGHSELTYAVPVTSQLWLASRFRFNINSLESSVGAGLLFRFDRAHLLRARLDSDAGVAIQLQGRFLRGLYSIGVRLPFGAERPSVHFEVELLPIRLPK